LESTLKSSDFVKSNLYSSIIIKDDRKRIAEEEWINII